MSLIDNLNAINDCKEDIKNALINKGVDMNGVTFSGYAEKINGLQLESGDTPSAPVTSADYIFTNGYTVCGSEHDIVEFVSYEISLDENNQFAIELICPEEIPSYEGSSYCDIIFTVDIPEAYNITAFEFFEASSNAYIEQAYKENPRHDTTVRNGVTCKSYVRAVEDGIDYGSEYIAFEPLQYKITIEKK